MGLGPENGVTLMFVVFVGLTEDKLVDPIRWRAVDDINRERPFQMDTGFQHRGAADQDPSESFHNHLLARIDDDDAGQAQHGKASGDDDGKEPSLEKLVEPGRADLESELIVDGVRD